MTLKLIPTEEAGKNAFFKMGKAKTFNLEQIETQ